eukprot:Hpha_TRINITY_DN11828_c0_g2::TRINITY_DN11828_c0_g2_i1::g.1857::m.1857/K01738/cysK; cysteine synthase A
MAPTESLEQLIGNTPLIRLNRMTEGLKATVLVKLEGSNPGKSVKDRLGWGVIRDLERAGKISPGKSTLIEATSGNTGIAIAMLGAARGYRVILTMPESMSLERRVVLKSFGAEVVLTPKGRGMKGAIIRAEQLCAEINSSCEKFGFNAIVTRQFETESNVRIHRETTGPEIWRDTAGKVHYVVSGVGTGGTITGVAKYLKTDVKAKVKMIAVEPEESAAITAKLAGDDFKPAPHMIQGIGAGFIPSVLDVKAVDEVVKVSSKDAIEFAGRLPREEGLLVGISAGAAVAAALRVAARPEAKGKTIVVVLASQAERYLSTALFSSLFEECGKIPTTPESAFPKELTLPVPELIPPKGPFSPPTPHGIKADVTEAIGGTPLLRLSKITGTSPATIYAKLESENPGKSVKDRLALGLIKDAETAGLAVPGETTLVEATSGNTGIALAMIGAARGYKVVLTMPDSMSIERRVVLRAFGAEVVLTPAKKGLNGARYIAQKIHDQVNAKGGKALITHQFENPSNMLVHKQMTGKEIWDATEGKIDILIAGVGTGGTLTGCAQFFREQGKPVKIIAVEPAESPAIHAAKAGQAFTPAPHMIQGMGAGFLPNTLGLEYVDEILSVSSDAAMVMARRLSAEEGLLVGISSGANAYAAKVVADRPESKGKLIVTFLPSHGERYLSTALFKGVTAEARALPTTPESVLDATVPRGADF